MKTRILHVFLYLSFFLSPALGLAHSNPGDEGLKMNVVAPPEGPIAVVGEINSQSMMPSLYEDTSVALIDMGNIISGKRAEFIPDDRQILGYFTTPLFPGPGKYRIDLPIVPKGTSLDLDNDGQKDAGVQVFVLYISANIIGNSYLQQLEQFYTKASAILDPDGNLKGTLLVYAPDAEQKFPSGPGADGKWFTGDDPSKPLPQGYTKVVISEDGKVSFDRSEEVEINRLPAMASEVPNFSEQGILESYNSLLELLKERYAYTEYRKLDWDAIRERYLESVRKADATQDYSSYYLVLDSLALSIEDSHVSASARGNIDAVKNKKGLPRNSMEPGSGRQPSFCGRKGTKTRRTTGSSCLRLKKVHRPTMPAGSPGQRLFQ